jgi:hypothetical protein
MTGTKKSKPARGTARTAPRVNGHVSPRLAKSTEARLVLNDVRIDSSEAEIEFIRAMENYQRDNGRPSPTWSEVLDVLRKLGYRKEAMAADADLKKAALRQLCRELREERDRLHREFLEIKVERDQYLKSLYAMLRKYESEPINYTKKELHAMIGKGQSLEELIAELEVEWS